MEKRTPKTIFIITKAINQKEIKKVTESIKAICPIIEHENWIEESRNEKTVIGYINFRTKEITNPNELASYLTELRKHPKVNKARPEEDPAGELIFLTC